MADTTLLPGTLDLLILKAVSLGPLHGYAIAATMQRLVAAQPLLGTLAADPSVRGLTDALSLMVDGAQQQRGSLDAIVKPLELTEGSLFLSEPLVKTTKPKLGRSARIGVDYAEAWAEKPWRFFELGSKWVSRARPSKNKAP